VTAGRGGVAAHCRSRALAAIISGSMAMPRLTNTDRGRAFTTPLPGYSRPAANAAAWFVIPDWM
jgi:hypothetical protein